MKVKFYSVTMLLQNFFNAFAEIKFSLFLDIKSLRKNNIKIYLTLRKKKKTCNTEVVENWGFLKAGSHIPQY